jgi:hypothetical protein
MWCSLFLLQSVHLEIGRPKMSNGGGVFDYLTPTQGPYFLMQHQGHT